ncbi:MAG: hypothetical protein OXI64_05905 [Defluviicoccus sp.]|nr:hypothetical protein [Defluviicoccus sp.]MDE0334474.1 hypothetical protein [Defluviicoccus sp.]
MAFPRLRSVAVAAILVVALPAMAADEDCDPEVERALVESAESGARDDVRLVRHREMGIRDPDSLFDLSCVTRMFDYGHADILYRPQRRMTDILGLINRLICDKAREAFRGFSGRGFDVAVFARHLQRLPGLDLEMERGGAPDPGPREGERSSRDRWQDPDRVLRERTGVPSSPFGQAAPPAPRSRSEVLRSILGGDSERSGDR